MSGQSASKSFSRWPLSRGTRTRRSSLWITPAVAIDLASSLQLALYEPDTHWSFGKSAYPNRTTDFQTPKSFLKNGSTRFLVGGWFINDPFANVPLAAKRRFLSTSTHDSARLHPFPSSGSGLRECSWTRGFLRYGALGALTGGRVNATATSLSPPPFLISAAFPGFFSKPLLFCACDQRRYHPATCTRNAGSFPAPGYLKNMAACSGFKVLG